MLINQLTKRGDTIVEVLIAVAIISLVLAISYTSATQSLNNSRQSQERGVALKISESQIEQIKAYAKDPTKNVYNLSAQYCFDSNLSGNTVQFATPNPTYNPIGMSLSADDFTQYPLPGCKFQNFFFVAIKYTPANSGFIDDYFTIQVRWDRVGGQRDEITMAYRVHQ